MNFLLPTATSTQEAARAARTALLPVGSFEQHGEYLPLITDTVVACLVAGRIAEDYRLLLLPPVTVSCSHEHAGFAGTVSISARTLMAVVDDVDESLRASGIGNLVIVNGHGGNYALRNVVQQATVTRTRMSLFPAAEDWNTARVDAAPVLDAQGGPGRGQSLLQGPVVGGQLPDALLERGVLGGDPAGALLVPLGLQVPDLAEEFADAGALSADLGVGVLERVFGV